MRIVVPDYYSRFRCLAGECRHNCCIGWEIDIDDETLSFYDGVTGKMGEKLASNICRDEESAHFCMKENGRCPFLNENDLCEIIINLGFDKVSQICDDHPRFRNFYSGREEIGLGMSCEAVAQLILTKPDKTQLVCLEDDEEELWPDEWDFLDLRDDIFAALQNREKPIDERIADALSLCGIQPAMFTASQLADIFLPLERLDEEWTFLLQNLKNIPEEKLGISDMNFDTAFEQLLIYLVFRHTTESLDDGCFTGRMLMVTASFYLIRYLCRAHRIDHGGVDMTALCEIARMFSAEIEYSTENTVALTEYFEKI
ncbi:MAG: flagellin lysine-N-methylase [Oscillospiraceae bacterium]|nr:flagellin lysine-N-methylase [Oscillospiraceae bacterium]